MKEKEQKQAIYRNEKDMSTVKEQSIELLQNF